MGIFGFFQSKKSDDVEKLYSSLKELKDERKKLLKELNGWYEAKRHMLNVVDFSRSPGYHTHLKCKVEAIGLCIRSLMLPSEDNFITFEELQRLLEKVDKDTRAELSKRTQNQFADKHPDLSETDPVYSLSSEYLGKDPKALIDRATTFLSRLSELEKEAGTEPLLKEKHKGYGGF